MTVALFSEELRYERDVVRARRHARAIAATLGFATQDQTRISTAVSEIARNAFDYGEAGSVEFAIDVASRSELHVVVRDDGPGIDQLDELLNGAGATTAHGGIGLRGARDLMDSFTVYTQPDLGTTVHMTKRLPAPLRLTTDALRERVLAALADQQAADPLDELRFQNEQLVRLHSRLRFLAEAGRALVASLDTRSTLTAALRLAIPTLAGHGALFLEQKGMLKAAATAARRTTKTVVQFDRGDVRPGASVRRAFRTGKSILQPEPDEAELLHLTEGHSPTASLAVPLPGRDRPLGVILLVSSEPREPLANDSIGLAEELGRRTALALSNAQLHESIRDEVAVRERIMAIVSHDLKSPLNAIGLSATLLREAVSDAVQRNNCDTIQRSVARMDHLIRDLSDVASIHAGELRIESNPVLVRDLLHQIRQQYDSEAEQKGIALSVATPAQDIRISGDRNRLLQVLSNLVGNAVKLCPGGATIRVEAEAHDHEVVLSVIDDGPGIPEEARSLLFEPYRSARRDRSKGSGLGLFIAQGIVRAHGGRIWADFEVPVGTTIRFAIPR